MMSATTQPQHVLHRDREYNLPMATGVERHPRGSEDHARYMYAKYLTFLRAYLTSRMLFEHTQRQYARSCNRILRHGQVQQEMEKQQNQPNGVT